MIWDLSLSSRIYLKNTTSKVFTALDTGYPTLPKIFDEFSYDFDNELKKQQIRKLNATSSIIKHVRSIQKVIANNRRRGKPNDYFRNNIKNLSSSWGNLFFLNSFNAVRSKIWISGKPQFNVQFLRLRLNNYTIFICNRDSYGALDVQNMLQVLGIRFL